MELKDTSKEKIFNALLYFCQNTKHLSETKLYKLLFFFDFIHFKEVGRSVTNLDYFAWDFGPVPQELYFSIKDKKVPEEISKCIVEEKDELTKEPKAHYFRSKKKPNLKVFSEREIEILEKIAFIFKEAKAWEMSEITHLKNTPYDKTLKTKGEKAKIDYLLALDEDAKIGEDVALERKELSNEMRKLFGAKK